MTLWYGYCRLVRPFQELGIPSQKWVIYLFGIDKYNFEESLLYLLRFHAVRFRILRVNSDTVVIVFRACRLQGSLWGEVQIVVQAETVQEGLRHMLRQVQLCSAGHVWELWGLCLLCNHDNSWLQTQVPVVLCRLQSSYISRIFLNKYGCCKVCLCLNSCIFVCSFPSSYLEV